MNRLGLGFMMVFLIQPSTVSPQAALTKPRITLNEKMGVYYQGETVTITCSRGLISGNATFSLYRDQRLLSSHNILAVNNSGVFTLNALNAGGMYQCQYAREIAGEWVTSPKSQTVRVLVTDPPVTPTIHQKREFKEFVKGESLKLVCKAKTPSRSQHYSLHRGGEAEVIQSQRAEYSSRYATFEVQAIVQIGKQNFTCSYWRSVSGRVIFSERSNPIAVTVIARPAKPILAPTGPYRVFINGELVKVTCTAPTAVSNATFLLYQGGEKEAVASETYQAPARSATFDITQRQGLSIRHYACGYLTSVSERRVESERSVSLKVVVEIALVNPHLYFEGVTRMFEVGESARLECQGAFQDRSSTFYLYKGGVEEPLMTKTPRDLTFYVPFNIRDHMVNGTEYYSCAYRRRLADRTVLSGRSNLLAVTAHNPLSKPELVLDVMTGVYSIGQTMRMTCKGEVDVPHGLYYFYRDGQPAHTGEPQTFQTVYILGSNREGNYTCKYAMPTPGTWFASPLSDGVRVTEIGDLPRPTISLEGGVLQFLAGESINISCAAVWPETGRRFYLYQSLGMRPVLSKKAEPEALSVTFDIQNVTRSANDYYKCAYRRHHAGVESFSQLSEPLKITSISW